MTVLVLPRNVIINWATGYKRIEKQLIKFNDKKIAQSADEKKKQKREREK